MGSISGQYVPRWYRTGRVLCRLGLHRWRVSRVQGFAHIHTASIRYERCARLVCPAERSGVVRHPA